MCVCTYVCIHDPVYKYCRRVLTIVSAILLIAFGGPCFVSERALYY